MCVNYRLATAPGRVEGGGQPVLSFEQCFILFCSFPLLFAFVVGGLGFEFCVFIAGWRHALRSEWPFIIIINKRPLTPKSMHELTECILLLLSPPVRSAPPPFPPCACMCMCIRPRLWSTKALVLLCPTHPTTAPRTPVPHPIPYSHRLMHICTDALIYRCTDVLMY